MAFLRAKTFARLDARRIEALVTHQHTMSEKKRKRHEDRPDGRPSKKIATERPSQTIKVSVIDDNDEWVPILGECNWSFCWLGSYR